MTLANAPNSQSYKKVVNREKKFKLKVTETLTLTPKPPYTPLKLYLREFNSSSISTVSDSVHISLGVILPVFGAVYLWEAASRSQGQELLSTAAVDVTVSHGAALTHHHMSARNKIPGTYTTHINAIAPHKNVSFILFKHLW